MNKIDDGGPAFPVHEPFDLAWRDSKYDMRYVSGMTLRDYFAAKAMLGFIMEPVEGTKDRDRMLYNMTERNCADIADASYMMADAMLKARNS